MKIRGVGYLMESDSWLSFLLFVMLVLGGGYFAGIEISYASANKIRLKNYAENGDHRAKKALYIIDNFDKALTTLLIGNNLMHIGCAALATLIATKLWGVGSIKYTTIAVAIIVFLISEMIPKSYAKSHAEQFALAVSGSMCFLMKLLTPISMIFTMVNKFVSRFFKENKEPTVTEDELYDIIENITENGSLTEEKGELIYSALEFDDINVQEVFTPRVDVVAIDADASYSEILDIIRSNKYSRYPVYRETIDNIIGILSIRKFLKNYLKIGDAIKLEELVDEPHFVYRKTRIDEVLRDISNKRVHMSIVTDDYGGTMGIVTAEDILEELVGEIWDEDDVITEDFIAIGGNRFEVNGNLSVEDIFEQMKFTNYDEDDIAGKTMSSWVLEHFNYIPKEGSEFRYKNLHISVKDYAQQRIARLLIKEENEVDSEVKAG